MRNIHYEPVGKGYAKVGEVDYGIVITEAPGHPQSIYAKVDKRALGQRLSLNWTSGYSVLFNLKTGSLRQIPGDTVIRVLHDNLTLAHTEDISSMMKGSY